MTVQFAAIFVGGLGIFAVAAAFQAKALVAMAIVVAWAAALNFLVRCPRCGTTATRVIRNGRVTYTPANTACSTCGLDFHAE